MWQRMHCYKSNFQAFKCTWNQIEFIQKTKKKKWALSQNYNGFYILCACTCMHEQFSLQFIFFTVLKQTNLNSLNSWIKLFSFWLKVKFKLKICFTYPRTKHPEFVFKSYSLMNYNIWQKNFRPINCSAAFNTYWLSVEKEVKPHSHMCTLRVWLS